MIVHGKQLTDCKPEEDEGVGENPYKNIHYKWTEISFDTKYIAQIKPENDRWGQYVTIFFAHCSLSWLTVNTPYEQAKKWLE